MKHYNTSGQIIPEEQYTIERIDLIKKGFELVENKRYFTIYALPQTDKSTYFGQLTNKLIENG